MSYEWSATSEKTNSGNKLFEVCDVTFFRSKIDEFKSLSKSECGKYKGAADYISKTYNVNMTPLKRNYTLFRSEIDKQLSMNSFPNVIFIDYILREEAIFDLLASFEDEKYVKEIYRQKKLNVSEKSGLNTVSAKTIVECLKQGRSLLQAGQHTDILTKPLIDFYAATAYAYAIIVINSPIHKSLDSLNQSHGHKYIPSKKSIDFGGTMPRGTFLDLIGAVFMSRVMYNDVNIQYSIINSIENFQNNNMSLSLSALLSMVPEIQDDYQRFDDKHCCVHRLTIDTERKNAKLEYNFYVGDELNKPNDNKLKDAFLTSSIKEIQDSYQITIDANNIGNIKPTIYKDIRGGLWYIDSPIEGVVLPEICIHFLIISALCSIMRYTPHEWSDILSNKVSSTFSLLINRYLRLFEKKFPMLVVPYISNYSPIFKRM